MIHMIHGAFLECYSKPRSMKPDVTARRLPSSHRIWANPKRELIAPLETHDLPSAPQLLSSEESNVDSVRRLQHDICLETRRFRHAVLQPRVLLQDPHSRVRDLRKRKLLSNADSGPAVKRHVCGKSNKISSCSSRCDTDPEGSPGELVVVLTSPRLGRPVLPSFWLEV